MNLLNLTLKIGQEFSPEELERLKDTAVLDKAFDRCLNLISDAVVASAGNTAIFKAKKLRK